MANLGIAKASADCHNFRVLSKERGLENPAIAVGIDRNDAAKPAQKAGEAAVYVQAAFLEVSKDRRG